MNSIASFRMCTLPTIDLIAKIDVQTDVMFKTQKVPSRHIPAQPNEDYDLLVGELVLRALEFEKFINVVENTLVHIERTGDIKALTEIKKRISPLLSKPLGDTEHV